MRQIQPKVIPKSKKNLIVEFTPKDVYSLLLYLRPFTITSNSWPTMYQFKEILKDYEK